MTTFVNPAPIESDARNEPAAMDAQGDKPHVNGTQVNVSTPHLSNGSAAPAGSAIATPPEDNDVIMGTTGANESNHASSDATSKPSESVPTSTMTQPLESLSIDAEASVLSAPESVDVAGSAAVPAGESALEASQQPSDAAAVATANNGDDGDDVDMSETVDTTKPSITNEDAPESTSGEPSSTHLAIKSDPGEDVKHTSSFPGTATSEGALGVSTEFAPIKVSREREEDETSGQPSAKRAKTEESTGDIKMGEGSAVEEAVPQDTMGDATANDAPQYAPISASTPTSQPPQPVQLPPSTPSFDTGDMTEIQKKKLQEGLRNVKKSKAAQAYLRPVDPVALNIPNYPVIVKTPMDLGTIETKLRDGKYANVDAYIGDWDLMVNNSILFNGQQHVIAQQGLQARSQMQAQLRRMPKSTDPVPAPEVKKPRSPSLTQPPREASRRTSMPKQAAPAPAPVPAPVPAPAPPPPAAAAAAPVAAPPPPPAPTPAAAPAPAPAAANEPYAAPNGVPTIRRGSSTNLHRPKREIHKPSRELAYQHSKPVKKKHKPELDFCKHVLDEMTRPRYESLLAPFAKPVDPVALAIPNYFKIVKKPMDISTARDKLNRGQYQNAKEFEADIKLIWANCAKFNGEGHPLVNIAREYERMFDEELSKKADWLAANAPESVPPSPVEVSEEEEEEPSEDEDEPGNELLAIQQQMQELQQRTAELMAKQQKAAQKKAASAGKKGAKGAKAAAKPKRKSGGGAAAKGGEKKTKGASRPKRPLTTAEKTEISTKIGNLDAEEIMKAANIIKTSLRAAGKHELADKAEDEMEFDIDTIPDQALHDLLKLVRKSVLPAENEAPPAPRQYTSAKPKKNKPMNKAEQASQIARLEGQLAHFEQGTSPVEDGGDSDDDSDDSGSESEEE